MHLSTLNSNNVRTAVLQRSAISERCNTIFLPECKEEFPFGEDVKMVRAITQRPVYLTPAERAEVAIKYKRGMSMVALSDKYGCHHSTVGRILKIRGVVIRDAYSRKRL